MALGVRGNGSWNFQWNRQRVTRDSTQPSRSSVRFATEGKRPCIDFLQNHARKSPAIGRSLEDECLYLYHRPGVGIPCLQFRVMGGVSSGVWKPLLRQRGISTPYWKLLIQNIYICILHLIPYQREGQIESTGSTKSGGTAVSSLAQCLTLASINCKR
jgi:hypothetical protein